MIEEKESDYFDHEADIGIIGRGASLEEAFCYAASAVFEIMTDLTQIRLQHKVSIVFKEADIELALVTWLNTLLAKANEGGLIFSKFELTHTHSSWSGQAYGDKWQDDYTRGTEVKGATLTMLKVTKNHRWEARCVVDV
jgi:SHS2 domain-containing protein